MTKAIFFNDIEKSFLPNMLKEMYIDNIYKPFFSELKDPVVLDLGANIGMFTLYAYNKSSKIYALEPSKEHIENFKKMIDFNEMNDKVTLIEKAIAMTDGVAELYNPSNQTAKSLNPVIKPISNSVDKVETICMETLFTQYNIDHFDFVKMDIEGIEMEIIGGSSFEKVADKIHSLVLEYHTWENRIPAQLITTLNDYGFKVWPIVSGEVTLLGAKRI